MALTRLSFVNTRGIPCLATIRAAQSSTGLTFFFNSHPYVNNYFQGLFVVKVVGTPAAPTTAVPVYFETDGVSGSSIAVNNSTGAGLTTSDFPGDGVYLFWYDRDTNVLRLINTII